jgi:hypothetical protein
MSVTPAIAAEVERILAAEARRLLAQRLAAQEKPATPRRRRRAP